MNRLADETSPYLRQHAANPVDWYPWGDDAFDRAVAEDRPVFLSIGYSACHWCHVMAHESFENEATAAALNASFVCVKVDREERPDVDAVYMEAVQAITGSGGWPMSVFLTPDRRPFFGGTYFPPEDRHGNPSFGTVLAAIADVWTNRRHEVEEQAGELSRSVASRSTIIRPEDGTSVLGSMGGSGGGPDLLDMAVVELDRRFDTEWGGFGPAPKFPQPALVDLVLRHGLRPRAGSGAGAGAGAGPRHSPDTHRDGSGPSPDSLAMATTTLDAMAAGGIHDHLGGGFARYSTDTEWLVPHFEKMLYDQAGLLRAFLHGWQVTGRPAYLHVVEGIVGYVCRDLSTPEGGLCSAEDADSEGVEGRFYVWTRPEVETALSVAGTASSAGGAAGAGTRAGTDELIDAACTWFDITDGGNFDGATILRRPLAAPLVGPDDVETARRLLFEARTARTRPGLDDKVLTEWNAMFASALAEAAAATGRAEWRDTAVAIGEFLHSHLRRPGDGRWLRSWQRDGGARHRAYAADYAWVIDCFTRLGELTGEARWTARAIDAADALLDLFHDDTNGGFFTTGHDAESLIVRTKDIFDGAVPSANAVAALALTRLGALTGNTRYADAAREVIELVGDLLVRHPIAFAHALATASLIADGTTEVVIVGDRPDLLNAVRNGWRPDAVVAWGEPTSSPLWDGREEGFAYVCRNYACRMPASDASTLVAQLTTAKNRP